MGVEGKFKNLCGKVSEKSKNSPSFQMGSSRVEIETVQIVNRNS